MNPAGTVVSRHLPEHPGGRHRHRPGGRVHGGLFGGLRRVGLGRLRRAGSRRVPPGTRGVLLRQRPGCPAAHRFGKIAGQPAGHPLPSRSPARTPGPRADLVRPLPGRRSSRPGSPIVLATPAWPNQGEAAQCRPPSLLPSQLWRPAESGQCGGMLKSPGSGIAALSRRCECSGRLWWSALGSGGIWTTAGANVRTGGRRNCVCAGPGHGCDLGGRRSPG